MDALTVVTSLLLIFTGTVLIVLSKKIGVATKVNNFVPYNGEVSAIVLGIIFIFGGLANLISEFKK